MARLMLPVVSPDAPPTLARHFGWHRPMVEDASPDASACVARSKRDSRPTLSDLSPETQRSASRGLRNRQSAVKSSFFCEKWEAESSVSVAHGDITTGCESFYRLGYGRYIEWGRVVISSVGLSIYQLVPTRSIGLPKSIYRPCGLLRATTRPPWVFRSTDPATSVDRPRHFGRPTLPTRWTDFAAVHGWQLELPRSIFAGTCEMV